MTTTSLRRPADLLDLEGTVLGTGQWHLVSQQQVDLFADATGDHQWIHTDPERAATGPFGGTIAHGYLTLALAPELIAETLTVQRFSAVLNYGLNKVRFPAPVPVGGRIRGTVTLLHAGRRQDSVEAVLGLVVELAGSDRPACVAEVVVLYR